MLVGAVFVFWDRFNDLCCFQSDALDMLLLTLQQCAIVYEFDVPWPGGLEYLSAIFEAALFDVDLVAPNCVMRWTARSSFYLQMLLPFFYACFFAARLLLAFCRAVASGAAPTARGPRAAWLSLIHI